MPCSTWVEDLRSRLRCPLIGPGDPAYDAARRVWNGMIDRRPAMIARCRESQDVAACVRFACANDVPISIRSGGHNYAGKAVCEGGLMIGLSAMKDIAIDLERRTARAQTGLKLGELDRETQKAGLATPLGVATTTGIGGLTLGGGYGWLAGKYGLACDNVTWMQVVTAQGETVECSEEQNADLFWGMRGAGANFGIATAIEYRLHPVGTIYGGAVFHPLSPEVMRFYADFADQAPDELTLISAATWGPDGKPAFATVLCHCGDTQEAEKLLEPLRRFAPPLVDMIQERPYLEMQSMFDADYPPGRRYYNKSHNITRFTEAAIDTVIRFTATMSAYPSMIGFQQLHGAASRVPVTATAFPHRHDHHVIWISPVEDDPAKDAAMVRWARECWEALGPLADHAVYVNALDDAAEEGEGRVREAYGANYDRLKILKKKYDPGNLFRQNSNINPD